MNNLTNPEAPKFDPKKDMLQVTGTKTILIYPMNKAQYCAYQGWELPEGQDPTEAVYLVEYAAEPGKIPNHPNHEGFVTMSPKDVLDRNYAPSGTFMERLEIEWKELTKKIGDLSTALHLNYVPDSAVAILTEQLVAMTAYQEVLHKRISK